ncbi:MAG TPA: hypothetical protein VGO62_19085, partial [Myxococcota bacterium]
AALATGSPIRRRESCGPQAALDAVRLVWSGQLALNAWPNFALTDALLVVAPTSALRARFRSTPHP